MQDDKIVDEVLATNSAGRSANKPKEKKESALKRLWNATVFPEMMAKKRAKKEAEAIADAKVKAKLDSIREKAREKAFDELEPTLIDKMKEEEMRKMTGEAKKDKLKKFGDAFKLDGFDTNDKLGRMLGGTGNQQTLGRDPTGMGSYGGMSNDQIAGAMGSSMRGLPRSNDEIVDGIGQGRKTISNREIEDKMAWHEGKNSSKIIDVTPVEIYEPKKKKKPTEYKSEGDIANERLSRMLGK
jgi:hypothetical protein